MKRLLTTALCGLLLVVAAAACQPTAATPVWTAPTVAASSPEGTLVNGDSITWQAYMSGYLPADGTEYNSGMGWKIDNPEVNQRITARRDAGTLTTLVLALGTNDSNPTWNGGWTTEDEVRWLNVVNQLHAGTRVAIVLPWVDPAAQPAHAVQVEKARNYMYTLADVFGVALVDWKPIVQEGGVLSSDGIHLAYEGDPAWDVTPEAGAARAYAIAIARGVDAAEPIVEVPASLDTPAELEAAA